MIYEGLVADKNFSPPPLFRSFSVISLFFPCVFSSPVAGSFSDFSSKRIPPGSVSSPRSLFAVFFLFWFFVSVSSLCVLGLSSPVFPSDLPLLFPLVLGFLPPFIDSPATSFNQSCLCRTVIFPDEIVGERRGPRLDRLRCRSSACWIGMEKTNTAVPPATATFRQQ